jgi:hypothetical protein
MHAKIFNGVCMNRFKPSLFALAFVAAFSASPARSEEVCAPIGHALCLAQAFLSLTGHDALLQRSDPVAGSLYCLIQNPGSRP